MADKKLNEVTKVTDMAYVPVIMADGSIGQIAKADLASVVAGLTNTNFGYSSLEDLAKGLPVKLRSWIKSIPPDTELDLGLSIQGLIFMSNTTSGGCLMFPSGVNIITDSNVIYANKSSVSVESGSGNVVLNRKSVNGNFFVKNEKSTNQSVRIFALSVY